MLPVLREVKRNQRREPVQYRQQATKAC